MDWNRLCACWNKMRVRWGVSEEVEVKRKTFAHASHPSFLPSSRKWQYSNPYLGNCNFWLLPFVIKAKNWLHKTTLPTGWVLSTQSKIEKETRPYSETNWPKNRGNSMRPTVNKMHSIKYIGSFSNPDQARFEGLRGPPPLCGDSLLPAVNFQERANHLPQY